MKLLHNLQSIYNQATKIEDDLLKKKMTDRFSGYLCRSLRNVLLQMLEKMLTEEVAAESFERFFNFTVECVKRDFFPKRDIAFISKSVIVHEGLLRLGTKKASTNSIKHKKPFFLKKGFDCIKRRLKIIFYSAF